ncbi:17692_t:CDS:2 [Cetraspora pellucida]|uniref:17692_t:CDS:1 n=1 Tax=Cetraspora pellucida TaxID=1433469 RepID=A0ACA9MEZ1_9GLOM|nr:17692_t:CDS:2 [Cetraspora pellucida]
MSDAYLEYIEEFSIEIADFNPIGPTAYIPLPETLPKRNNGIINIQNDDNWSFVEELNMDDIPIPIPVSTPVYKKFEENNSEISLCVYEWHNHNECLEFHYVSERRGDEYKQVNLLVITEEERSHYCIIKDLHKLIRYNKHLPKCKGLNNAFQRPQMPVKNRNLEMLTEKLTSEEKTKLTHTERLQMHKPCGYCYVVVHMDSSLNYEIISHDLYRGPDALERFVTKIEKKLANIQEDLSVPAEMIMAPGDLKAYNEDFYSLLSQQNISKEDYEHAQKVWQIFEIKNFEEYYDLYLETDVLLLADVFMNYTIMCLKDDGLGPSHYVSASEMFNDSLYKSSRIELKFMTDMDEYLIVENRIRRGMTMASHRYAKANNSQCPDYEPSKPKSWALYEDMNALYSDTEIGYILEVDLEAPVHLHDYFADYPFVPEKQIIPEN